MTRSNHRFQKRAMRVLSAPRPPLHVRSRWLSGFGTGLICGLCVAALVVAL